MTARKNLCLAMTLAAWFTACSPRVNTLDRVAMQSRADVRSGVTLATWRSTHPADTVATAPRDTLGEGPHAFCARAVSTTVLDSGRTARQLAFFFLPPVNDSFTIRFDEEPRAIIDNCRLGYIWVETATPDSAQGIAFGARVRDSLVHTLGASGTERLFGWGVGSWQSTAIWVRDSIEIVVATTKSTTRAGSQPKPVRTFVAMSASRSSETFRWSLAIQGDQRGTALAQERPLVFAHIDDALTLASLPATVDSVTRALLAGFERHAFGDRFATVAQSDSIATVVLALVQQADTLPTERRAATLLAADLLTEAAEQTVQLGSASALALRDRFVNVGAVFRYDQLGAWYQYTRTWLKQAYAAAPEGRVHDLAFLVLMEIGFETMGTCSEQGSHAFRGVITRGEAWLAAHPDSRVRADVQRMVGDAYSTIVALAHGHAYYEPDSVPTFVREAPAARAKALENYRIAFTGARPLRSTRESWENALRLQAGLIPSRTFYYCVYD